MKKYILTFLIFSVFLVPTFSYAEEIVPIWAGQDNCVSLNTTIRYKMRDASAKKDVWNLQSFLQKEKFLTVNPTGYFGNATLKGVKDFQKKYNIPPTGLVGSITRAKIKEISCTTTTTTNTDPNTTVNNATDTNTTNTTTTTTETTTTTTNNDEILTAPNNSSLKVRTEGVVSSTSATTILRGYITAGARSATKGWIEVTKNPTVYKVSETIQGIKTFQRTNDKFDQTFTGLNAGTTYYYRACAENTDLGQKSCGTTSYFTTPN